MDFDIAVIGAGLAGLTCAAQLQQVGYRVVAIEKSRGLGGRVASYRLNGHRADRGSRYITENGRLLSVLVKMLRDRQLLQPWTDISHTYTPNGLIPQTPQTQYIVPEGMNTLGKLLGRRTTVWFSRRLHQLTPTAEGHWNLQLDAVTEGSSAPLEVEAKVVIVAIPAPQALLFLEKPLTEAPDVLAALQRVQYDPCLTVMAKYPAQAEASEIPWKSVDFEAETALFWVGLDSSKRPNSDRPVVVIHSSADFARSHFDAPDLDLVADKLVHRAADALGDWLRTPELVRLHRWRYAFPSRSWHQDCLVTKTPLPLVCCGDWCGSRQMETALRSGLAAASVANSQLEQRVLPPIARVWETLLN